MHDSDPVLIPSFENGLPVLKWRAAGFHALRAQGLLSSRYKYEHVDGIVLHSKLVVERNSRIIDELAFDELLEASGPAV